MNSRGVLLHDGIEYRFRLANWSSDSITLSKIREAVFIQEQQVPVELEWDEFDASAWHFLITKNSQHSTTDGAAIATARLLPNGHFGRMAVLKDYRLKGIGAYLIQQVETFAIEQNLARLDLAAQTHANGFYQRLGYTVTGEIFMDAGIPHRNMFKILPDEQ